MKKVLEKFLRYVKYDTQSDENSETFPSTEKQKNLGELLAAELEAMGAADVYFDREKCYVYAVIPANDQGKCKKTLGFIAHMDTSPDISGSNVNPRIIENYDGNDIVLNGEKNIVLSTEKYPEIKAYTGQTLVVTDGTTLLGADDKAGVAEIMTMAEYLLSHPEITHGKISVAFTPDEEIGCGVDYFDHRRFGADYAYTVDGGAIGELEYENFNAASAVVKFHGVNVHPGEAKNKMKNSMLTAMEFSSLLPCEQRPQFTSGYEGFIHLCDMKGDVENSELTYIVRDHDMKKFEEKKNLIENAVKFINAKYGEGTAEAEIKDSYFNMRDRIYPEYSFLIENAEACMKELGIEPKILPIRGGTDGARLSFEGIPCPNICTGGHNFHGRYEYICAESMGKIVNLLVNITTVDNIG